VAFDRFGDIPRVPMRRYKMQIGRRDASHHPVRHWFRILVPDMCDAAKGKTKYNTSLPNPPIIHSEHATRQLDI
jgi:hypothetical protein